VLSNLAVQLAPLFLSDPSSPQGGGNSTNHQHLSQPVKAKCCHEPTQGSMP